MHSQVTEPPEPVELVPYNWVYLVPNRAVDKSYNLVSRKLTWFGFSEKCGGGMAAAMQRQKGVPPLSNPYAMRVTAIVGTNQPCAVSGY